MKKYIIYLGIICVCYSFGSKSNMSLDKSNKKPVPTNLFTSTLDSLQGTWISNKDISSKIIINTNQIYFYYDTKCIDTFNVLLADGYFGDAISLYNKSQVNGKYLIAYTDGYEDYDLSYRISYLSNISLELVYNGKHLPFTKQ